MLTVVLANGTLNSLAAVEVVMVAAVETAAVPEHEPDEPVVFWLSVGTSATWMADIRTFVPLPRKYWPDVTAPAKAFIAPCAVVVPVPPLRIATVPVTFAAVPVVF